MNAILIDTNLLVYVYDRRDHARQETATKIVGTLARLGTARLSAQCLSEFFAATTKQKTNQEPILSVADALGETEKLARAFPIYPVTQQVVLEALRGVKHHKLHFWDAQIWASAHLNQIPTIFTQDFRSGSTLEGVKFVNPFQDDFRLQEWIN